ncbi:intracellular septation protein A [Hoeflea marina]|uniref:Inner membrane-spanning protein YciB n=1 Tax=Hoeflea marina TaxID=274592 RepID=A0A317PG13_9HYPH|nr:septation protein A [Hoeflea marina]PWV98296.1 intracellular septation protein A [Hoeflea marina]
MSDHKSETEDQSLFERDPADPKRKHINPVLKLALELGPLLVFFFANSKAEWMAEQFPMLASLGKPIFIASAAFMAATAIALTISWILLRSLPIMPILSAVVIFVFGAIGFWLHDEFFFKIKPTIINTMFGTILLGGLWFGRSLLGYVFDSAFQLDAEGWRKLTFRWGVYFLVMAVVNEVMWRNFSTDTWIAFKVWGNMPLSILFMLAQMPLMMRHALPEEAKDQA